MRYIFIFLILLGCGADPDDFQIQKSDGCRSDDLECQKAKLEEEKAKDEAENEEENEGSKVTDLGSDENKITEENANNCMAGKICRGMTKAEVLDLLGDPKTLEKLDPFEKWEWRENYSERFICGSYYNCTITFRDGLVIGQKDINTQWLDLENF